jgi:SanA protein
MTPLENKTGATGRQILSAVIKLVLTFGIGMTLWSVWVFTRKYSDRIYSSDQIEQIPSVGVGIVFGAGYWPSGRLSDVLRDRLDAAAELYEAGKVSKLLLSGDNRVVEYNEPARMRAYLLERGIPEEDLVLDFAGRRTYDTCYRARDIFLLKDVILVTQRYHLPRALETCSGLGLDAVGYEADRTTYVSIRWYRMREIPALWRAWWDLTIQHPAPVLGDPIPIED